MSFEFSKSSNGMAWAWNRRVSQACVTFVNGVEFGKVDLCGLCDSADNLQAVPANVGWRKLMFLILGLIRFAFSFVGRG